ncbi:MAG: peptidoglycan DD-metalloendopeptidase family protein [Dongiaceae bacterium]
MTARHKLLWMAGGMTLALLAGCNESGRPLSDGTAGPAFNGVPPALGVVQGSSYIVAPGDTVGTIAERTNTPVRTLIDLNHLIPPYRLPSGTTLLLQPRASYVVRQGDTIETIAQSQGVSESTLIQLNGLTAPYTLQAGRSLVMPSGVEASNAPNTVAVGQSFVVPPATPDGSTAPVTAPSGAVSKAALPPLSPSPSAAAASSVASAAPKPLTAAAAAPAALPSKTIETQPMAAATATAPATASATQAAAAKAAQTDSLPPPPDPVLPPDPFFKDSSASKSTTATSSAVATSAATTTQMAAKAPSASTGNGQFGWPVQGNIVSKFGATADGLRNDGINIAAPAGSPVQAAADGVVAYAGNELRGFGNMVLIRHANGWVTAYAHNQSLTVKKGDQVKRGQTIARVGATGNVQSPQLHFEIRKGTSAVDPMKYLGS